MKNPPIYSARSPHLPPPPPAAHLYNSLPRKTSFHRNAPARRSMGAEPLVEYFVPRSVSEFDLSITTDVPLLNTRLAPPKPIKNTCKRGEKMVTFEDELEVRQLQGKNPLEDVFM